MRLVPDQVGVGALSAISNRLWDLRANLMADIVDQHGSIGAMTWFARNMPRYERILAAWGPIRTHLVTTVLSLDTGCAYCSFGHAHAFQLHYFRDTDRLFPLSEDDLLALNGADRDALTTALHHALVQADLGHEWPAVERALELKDGATVDGADDEAAAHLVSMFEWLNACGIAGSTEPDEAHDPINKDIALKTRYAEARAARA